MHGNKFRCVFTDTCTAISVSKEALFQAEAALTVNTSNTLLCVGNSATLTVNGANSYTWSTNVTSNSIVVSPMDRVIDFHDGNWVCKNGFCVNVNINHMV